MSATPSEWTREAFSRRLAEIGRAPGVVDLPAGPGLLDSELLDAVNVSHIAGPAPGGGGWADLAYQRLVGELVALTFNPGDLSRTRVRVRDLLGTMLLGAFDSLANGRGFSPVYMPS